MADYSNHHHHHQPPPNYSLSSQPSLASVPSLNITFNNNSSTSSYICLTTLKNTSYTSSLAVSGKFLYTGSSNREITSWNRNDIINSTATNTVFVAGKGAVKSLVVHSDKLFTAHQDHKIRVWKITDDDKNHEQDQQQQKYTRLATLPTLTDRVTKLLVPNSHVQIRRHKKCTWVHHVDTVSSLALSKDGTLLYSVSWDRTIKVWRTKDFACLESVTNAHDDAINAVAVSDDGRVYTGSADKKIKVWEKTDRGEKRNKNKHSLVETLEKHNSGINALALSSDGSILYSGACDRSILVWEKDDEDEDGKMVVVGAIRGHSRSILCLVVVLDFLCSGSEDKTIRVWRGSVCREYSCMAVLEGHRGPIKSLTAVVDHCDNEEASFLVYSGSLDCDLKVWQVFVHLL